MLQRPLDDVDGAIDAGAESAGIGKHDSHGAILSPVALGGLDEPGIEQQQRRADANRRIGHVEGRKVMPVPVCIDEVDDMTRAATGR